MKELSPQKRAAAPAPPGLQDILERLRRSSLGPESLSEHDLAGIDAELSAQQVREHLRLLLAQMDFSFQAEAEAWLAGFSSAKTVSNYRWGLRIFASWCAQTQILPLLMTPAQAAGFVRWIPGAPATVHLSVSAVSSWCSWLAARHPGFTNPFRKLAALPRLTGVRPLVIPSPEELARILAALAPPDACAVALMAYQGLRVGALPPLVLEGSFYRTLSKGKAVAGELEEQARALLQASGLDPARPFEGRSGERLREHLVAALARLSAAGVVRRTFTPHSFRHYFAVQFHLRHPDLHALAELMGHTDVMVTQRYLRSLERAMGAQPRQGAGIGKPPPGELAAAGGKQTNRQS